MKKIVLTCLMTLLCFFVFFVMPYFLLKTSLLEDLDASTNNSSISEYKINQTLTTLLAKP